jgi:hypothetical protein
VPSLDPTECEPERYEGDAYNYNDGMSYMRDRDRDYAAHAGTSLFAHQFVYRPRHCGRERPEVRKGFASAFSFVPNKNRAVLSANGEGAALICRDVPMTGIASMDVEVLFHVRAPLRVRQQRLPDFF